MDGRVTGRCEDSPWNMLFCPWRRHFDMFLWSLNILWVASNTQAVLEAHVTKLKLCESWRKGEGAGGNFADPGKSVTCIHMARWEIAQISLTVMSLRWWRHRAGCHRTGSLWMTQRAVGGDIWSTLWAGSPTYFYLIASNIPGMYIFFNAWVVLPPHSHPVEEEGGIQFRRSS